MTKIVVSGAQTTGNLHLGNYLGSIAHWVRMQDTTNYNCFFFLADLHAITTEQDRNELTKSILSVAAIYIAAGLSPDKVTIFIQSAVKEHVELAWILNCITPVGWLKRMTQFKDKAGKNQEHASLGLFAYPVLMAADILLYNADLVPVGDDQRQHLELVRDIAGVINRKFDKEIFVLPTGLIQGSATRIMSLRNGAQKMSKSDTSDASRINLCDNSDQIYNKIKKAKTDSIDRIYYDPDNRPEITNLLNIYSSLAMISIDKIVEQYDSASCTKFKHDLAELVIAKLEPINVRYNDLMRNKDYLLKILRIGANVARNVAEININKIKQEFGFID